MTGCTKTNAAEYSTVAGQACTTQKCKSGILRLGVFFDGTGNDDVNPIEFSNVKKLFDVYPEKDFKDKKISANGKDTTTHSAYIRGVGSRGDADREWAANEKLAYAPKKHHKSDGTTGGMWGAGGHARISDILFQLQNSIDLHKDNFSKQPKKILLDVFGFSRGAIQARHFVNVIKQGFYKLEGAYADYEPKDFTVKTLNIFDSVSSFEGLTVLTPGTPQDPSWAFNVEKGMMVERIIHLVADDEYRQNFDGQVITGQDLDYPKDLDAPLLTELVFLGAHSDIGGGYRPVHHGRNNNDLAKIYLNKMYEMALENKVPFKAKATGNDWTVPDALDTKFQSIQGAYKKYSELKVAHKKFRERMGYLYSPGSNKHPAQQLAGELKQSIDTNQAEITQLENKIATLEAKQQKVSGSKEKYLFGLMTVTKGDKAEFSDRLVEAGNAQKRLERINKDYNKKLSAYSELREVFAANEADYRAFIKVSVDFHNTYVHKSHSSMYQIDRSDYDAQDNKIAGRSRDKAGMNAEIDGGILFDGHLHRKWYYQEPIDVVSKICKREKYAQDKVEFYNSGFIGTIADYANRPGEWINKHVVDSVFVPFDWAKPKKLSS